MSGTARHGGATPRVALPLAALTAFAMACRVGDAPADVPAAFTVEDSAGIEIVESSAPAWEGDGWTIADEPRLSIGRTSGDERYLFGHIAGSIALPDGRIAVLDAQAVQVRVYSPQGVHLADWGGKGDTDEVRAAHEVWLRKSIMAPTMTVGGGSREQVLRWVLDLPYPATLPTFHKLLVDPDGNIWAAQRRYAADDEKWEFGMLDYFVFGPDGRHLGVIELPADLVVHQIGTDYILGVARDELGVQFVRVYEIVKEGVR